MFIEFFYTLSAKLCHHHDECKTSYNVEKIKNKESLNCDTTSGVVSFVVVFLLLCLSLKHMLQKEI